MICTTNGFHKIYITRRGESFCFISMFKMGPAVLSCIWTPRKKEFPPIYSKHVHPSKCCQGKEMFLLLVKADWNRSCMHWYLCTKPPTAQHSIMCNFKSITILFASHFNAHILIWFSVLFNITMFLPSIVCSDSKATLPYYTLV